MTRTIAQARDIFRRLYPYKNLITPDVIAYGWQANFAWELSSGEGIRIRSIHGYGPVPALFGVTVLECSGDNHTPPVSRHDMNSVFESEADARAYIADMFVKRADTDALAALCEQADEEGWDQ